MKVPENEEELVKLKNHLAENEVDLAKMKAQVDCVAEYINIIESFQTDIDRVNTSATADDFELYKEYFSNIYSDFFQLFYFSETIKTCVFEGTRNAQVKEEEFTSILEREKDLFEKELVAIKDDLSFVKKFSEYSKTKENNNTSESLKEKINAAKDKVKSFNDREIKLKLAVSEYNNLNEIETEFVPYYHLWSNSWEFDLKFEEWMHG